ncbi:MAG TPA: hypothetical protein VJV05_06330 [Pyrinomonadaceae bacterium]|nr:hypothetical protein [Pyrinomonadaceae bacterium]
MLIDEFLSDYDFVETHDISIRASPAEIYRAANEVDFSDSYAIKFLLGLRGLSTGNVTLRSLTQTRFEVLAETPGRELLLGLVGKFWTPRGDMQKIDAASFKDFKSSGYAKAVWNFAVHADNGESRLTTETRVKCLDRASRIKFAFYWTVVRPFSGLIRNEMLRLIKIRAEKV